MCGIAGIYGYRHEAPPVDREELLRIRERMFSRGPDGAGLWIAPDQRVGLAHRRLAILDLTEAGAQPMLDPDTGHQIVFNGEIYNSPALKAELEIASHAFRSHSDTEVLLKLYAVHGQDMLHKLRGMYAFAIWDARYQSLFMARDPLGIKPLYYADNGKTFRFASQVKALLKGGAIDTSPEPAGHVGFFLWGSVPEPYTLYRHIRALPAGHWIRVEQGRPSAPTCFDSVTQRLAQASQNPRAMPDDEALALIADATRQSIQAHLLADVPVGVFLSSGLDSAMLAATAARMGEVRTITLGFDEYQGTPKDESPLAEELARQLAARHSTVRITAAEFHADYEKLLDAMDQPSIDGVNTWFVAKAAASQGLKVALSGLGGDELFASYPSFQQVPNMQRRLAGFHRVPGLGKGIRIVTAPVLKRFTSPKYASLLEYGGSLGGAYLLRRGLYMPWELPEIMNPDIARAGWQQLNALSDLAGITEGIESSRLAVSALEMTCYMKNQLLRDADWAGMAHSTEIRVPFVDIELIVKTAMAFAAAPHLQKRQVAENVASRLPAGFLQRRKTGFSMPVRDWLDEESTTRKRGLRGWAHTVHAALTGIEDACNPRHIQLIVPEMATRGGIQSYMLRLWEMLNEIPDAQLECLSLNDTDVGLAQRVSDSACRLRGFNRSKLAFVLRQLLRKRSNTLAVVGHLHLAPVALAAKLLGRIRGYIVILHGIEAWQRHSWLIRWAMRQSISNVATTHYTANLNAQLNNVAAAHYHVIPLCAERDIPPPTPGFKLNGEFALLMVARLDASEKYKGMEMVIDAVAKLQDLGVPTHFNLVGDGDDRSRLEGYALEKDCAGHVTFWGRLNDADLQAAYKSAALFVMPSKKEGFGIVFLEAMRHGVPCIGGNHGGTPEVINEGVTGFLINYGDVDALVDRIVRLVSDDNLRARMSVSTRNSEAAAFSYTAFSNNWKKFVLGSMSWA
jgi:asparagine synthase (glutamine-hydrolysing)